jgi:hypothetical protein
MPRSFTGRKHTDITLWYDLCSAHMQQGNIKILISLCGWSYVPLICSKGTYIYTSWYKLWSAHMQQGNLHIHFVVQVMIRSYAARELTYTLRGTSYVPLICSKGTYIYTSWYKLCPAHMQQGNLHIHFVVQVMIRSYAVREHTVTIWTWKKWPSKTGDPLKKGSIYMKFSMTGQEKGGLLIQVTDY